MKGIIFDLDGTLIRLPINYPKLLERLKNLFGTHEDLKPLMPSVIKFANKNNSLLKNAFQIMTEEEYSAINNFQIINDAQEILAYFQKKGLMLGLITMQGRCITQMILEKFAPHTFIHTITRDESHDRLEQIQKMLKILTFEPNLVTVVGDRIHDAECAKRAGCSAILIKDAPIDYDRVQIISGLSELKNLI